MAQTLNLPIHVRFERIPVRWEIRSVKGDSRHDGGEYAFPTLVTDGSLDAFMVSELDAWTCRDEFFAIPENDNEKLRRFLERVGIWMREDFDLKGHWSKEVTRHYREGNPIPVAVPGLWRFRESLRRALVNKKAFKETYAAPLPRPKTGRQLLQQSDIEFPLSLELTGVAAGVVTLTDAYHMLQATVFFDVARGIRFKVCQREDCKAPFPVESEHERVFCTQYCGHLVSQRANRRAETIVRANPKLSIKKLIEKIKVEVGIKKDRDWVVKAKARTR
jgi:hypothetical protein